MKRHFFAAALMLSLLAHRTRLRRQQMTVFVRDSLTGSTGLAVRRSCKIQRAMTLERLVQLDFLRQSMFRIPRLPLCRRQRSDGQGYTDRYSAYETNAPTLAISPSGEIAWFQKNQYRGDFIYQAVNGRVAVVNDVPLEDYIKGVVPYEMSPSWHKEALKAQAVCARS